jgi:hypothetical protein
MGNRIFVGIVVLLWMGTMSWLMVARILPPFFNGDPPGHGVLARDEPVCWDIEHDGKLVGHAVSEAVPGALGTTEIHSRVQLDGLEIRKLAPQWMSTIVRGIGAISLDTRSRIVIDSLGNLTLFETRVRLNDLPLVMKVAGRVDGPDLVLKITSGDVTHTARYQVPINSLLSNELVPEPKMLQVYVGRKWQQEIYSPFRPPTSSLEVLQAEVVEESWFEGRGERTRAKKIEYRAMSPAGVAADNTLRAVVWVGDDGTVLRQDLYLMDTRLRFERRSEPHMLKLAEEMLDLENVATIGSPRDRAE